MTPAEYCEKFGIYKSAEDDCLYDREDCDVPINDNYLEDMACFECGYRESFSIVVTSRARIEDGSITEGYYESGDFNGASSCKCCECDRSGKVKDFTIIGLDDYIRNLDAVEKPIDPDPEPIPTMKDVEETTSKLKSLIKSLDEAVKDVPPPPPAWDTSGL